MEPFISQDSLQANPASPSLRERFLGCMLGSAVGDALGAPIEFMPLKTIHQKFGANGLTGYAPLQGEIGKITDDTQMTLFTAEGLLRTSLREKLHGDSDYSAITAQAYLRWLHTQGGSNTALNYPLDGCLIQQAALHSRRAPGGTCVSALEAMPSLGAPAQNNSKGCGGVMRSAPIGLFAWHSPRAVAAKQAFQQGKTLAALTHGHPTGSLTAGVLAVLVLALADGVSLPEALFVAKILLCSEKNHQETLQAIERAEQFAQQEQPSPATIAALGQGWVAEEALAIAVYCALVAKDFRHGILLAINHSGDSDSTGAITGKLLGAQLGVNAIPKEWLEPLELREIIEEIANDLHDFPHWDLQPNNQNQAFIEKITQKYPTY